MTTLDNPSIKPVEAPGPGVYEGISFDTYKSWPYVNNSGLSDFLRSPAHYVAGRDADNDTKAKTRGTVCHAGLLEPARFAAEYAIGPDVKLNTKGGKEEWEAFAAANPGRELVRGADGAAMLGVRSAVWAHPFASKLLASKGATEVSIVWRDAATGLLCKARIDKLAEEYSTVVDLKSTRDARPDEFSKSLYSYGYHRQSAFNLHGLAAVGLAFDMFTIVAIEPEPPYGLIVYEVDHSAVEAGYVELVAAMEHFAECKAADRWPAYPAEPQKIGLPRWAKNKTNVGLAES